MRKHSNGVGTRRLFEKIDRTPPLKASFSKKERDNPDLLLCTNRIDYSIPSIVWYFSSRYQGLEFCAQRGLQAKSDRFCSCRSFRSVKGLKDRPQDRTFSQ